jgi:integrase
MADACNRFLEAKERAVQNGELSQHSFADYRRTCEWLVKHFGRTHAIDDLTPAGFAGYRAVLAERRSPIALGNEVTRVRVFCKWCWEARLIKAPLHFGPDFKKPSQKVPRKQRREGGKKLFSAEQINLLLDECGMHLRAMVMLGINCGFGNTDCAMLPLKAVDLKSATIDYPRPKTEVERTVPLWPETVTALHQSLARRYKPDDKAKHLFFTRPDGSSWENIGNPIAKQIHQALMRVGIRQGGFYWLRHTFETIGGGTKDQVAVNAIMGHVDQSMAAKYREEISFDRLRAVTDHVRTWLFG